MTKTETMLKPIDYNCLIRLDPIPETIGEQKLIIMPDVPKDRQQQAVTVATLLAVGGRAFEFFAGKNNGTVPEIGDKVLVNKYAGQFREADPNDLDRIVTDKEILAVVG